MKIGNKWKVLKIYCLLPIPLIMNNYNILIVNVVNNNAIKNVNNSLQTYLPFNKP